MSRQPDETMESQHFAETATVMLESQQPPETMIDSDEIQSSSSGDVEFVSFTLSKPETIISRLGLEDRIVLGNEISRQLGSEIARQLACDNQFSKNNVAPESAVPQLKRLKASSSLDLLGLN